MVSVLAPSRGWDDTSPQALMEPGYAIALDNMWPAERSVDVRRGSVSHATGLGAAVTALMAWRGAGGEQLFATTADAIYDVTAPGPVGAAALDNMTRGDWAHVNFSTPAGAFLVACNGADGVRTYDGAAWATSTLTGGVDAAALVTVTAHQTRLWFVQKDSTKAWYLLPRAIAGAAAAFEFGAVWSRGGTLQALVTWTRDSGAGADDHLVAISSAGQIAVYSGTDPAAPATWALVGVYNGPEPLGRRCALNLGGDVLLLTRAGVISLAALVQSSAAQIETQGWTARVQRSVTMAAEAYGTLPGWQMAEYPAAAMVVVNVPASPAVQFVANATTGGWARWTGLDAAAWLAMAGGLFFARGQAVHRAWTGYDDDGAAVEYVMRTAFSTFESAGVKHVTLTRTYLETESSPPPRIRVNEDFRDDPPTSVVSFSPASTAVWDTAAWDEAVWPGVMRPVAVVQGAGAAGVHLSVHVRGSNRSGPLRFIGFDLIDRTGGPL